MNRIGSGILIERGRSCTSSVVIVRFDDLGAASLTATKLLAVGPAGILAFALVLLLLQPFAGLGISDIANPLNGHIGAKLFQNVFAGFGGNGAQRLFVTALCFGQIFIDQAVNLSLSRCWLVGQVLVSKRAVLPLVLLSPG